MAPGSPELSPRPAIVLLVRVGLPLAVGIHYLTAARGLPFTSDAAFGTAYAALALHSGGAGDLTAGFFSPLWVLLLEAANALGLDPVFAAKILSLFFSSLGVIAIYLFANEILDDRILAFLAALVSGLEPWFLAAGPAGTPLSLLFALSYGAYFFLRRREFAIGGICIGLAGLVCWPAFGLLSLLVVEVLTQKGLDHRRQTIVAGVLLTAATFVLWGAFAFIRALPLISGPELPGRVLPPSWLQGIPFLIAAAAAGPGWVATRRFPLLRLVFPESRRSLIALFAWGGLCAAAFSSAYLLLLVPACVVLALDGVRRIAPSMYREPLSYTPAFLLVALCVILNQGVSLITVQSAMAAETVRLGEVEAVAAWMRSNVPAGTPVGAEQAGHLGYLLRADHPVGRIAPGAPPPLVMASAPPDGRYAEIYRPSRHSTVALFKRTLEE